MRNNRRNKKPNSPPKFHNKVNKMLLACFPARNDTNIVLTVKMSISDESRFTFFRQHNNRQRAQINGLLSVVLSFGVTILILSQTLGRLSAEQNDISLPAEEQQASDSFDQPFDPRTISLSEQNYYAPKQTCVGCHEPEFRKWHGSNHHLAMGPATGRNASETVRADFNDTQFVHVGFDDLAKLSDDELKLVLAEVDLTVIAKGLTDARPDVLPKIIAALSPDENERLQKLMRHYIATVDAETATPRRANDGRATLFDQTCPVRASDAQTAHAATVDAMHRLAEAGKVDLSFGQLFRFFMQGGRPMVECENSRGERETFALKYTFGITPLQQYLVEFEDGRMQCLPVAWDVERERWFHLYPKERILFDDPLFWTKPTQNWNYMCASCHTTDLHKNYDVESNTYQTRFAEMSVGCQSCHGPCGLHVERMSIPGIAETGDRETDMALPIFSQMTAREETESCAPCHAHRRVLREGALPPGESFFDYYVPSLIDGHLFYADGQILEEDYEYTSFLQCRMSVENVRCTTCHDPHSSRLMHEGNALCSQCHDATVYDSAKHHHHEDATQPGTKCVECHMPPTTYMVLTPRHDHHIKVPDPDLTIRLGIPNACNNCHNDMAAGETPAWALRWVRHWYGPQKEQAEHFAYAVSGGRRGDAEALPKLLAVAANTDTKQVRPIVRASAISLLTRYQTDKTLPVRIAALTDVDPHVRLAAVSTFETESSGKRLAYLLPLLADETYAIRCEAARLLSVVPPEQFSKEIKAAFDVALQEYIASQNASLDHPASHLNLAVLWENLAQPKIKTAQQATQEQINVVQNEIRKKWYMVDMPEKQTLEAEMQQRFFEISAEQNECVRDLTQTSLEAYQRALSLDPEFVPARVNLAMLHNFRNEPQLAEAELRRTTEIAPENGEGFYSLGLFLAEQNRLEEAEVMLEKAQTLLPDRTRIAYNRGLLLMQLDKVDEAEQMLIRVYQANQNAIDIL